MNEKQKTALIAEKILGLKEWPEGVKQGELKEPVFYFTGMRCLIYDPAKADDTVFEPYQRIDQAWMIVDKIVTTDTIGFKQTAKFFSWWNSCALGFVTMTTKQFAAAICDGALAALGLLEE